MSKSKWKEVEEAVKKLFNDPDGGLLPVWLLCEEGICSDCHGTLPSDCACCLTGRGSIPECGCICHKRLKKICDFIQSTIIPDTRRELIKEIEGMVSSGYKRDEVYKKYGIDTKNTIQFEAFMNGWHERCKSLFDKLDQLKKKYGVEG